MLEIAIIGGGPAGLSAGLYAVRGGAKAALYEALFVGGQATRTHRIDNYPGFSDGVEGFELGTKLEMHAQKFGLAVTYEEPLALELSGEVKRIVFADRTEEARTVILCMGASPRKLGLPREEELTGAGVSYCATCDGAFFKAQEVAVVGGGDTAISDALYLARFVRKVYVVHRRDTLRAAAVLRDAAFAEPKIEFVLDSVPEALEGENKVEGLAVKNVRTGAERTLPVSGVFVAVGILPSTAIVRGQVACTAQGAIETDECMRTSIPGVFAAGDVRNTPLRQVLTACADGAVAATYALEYLAGTPAPGTVPGK